ncbi:hypothetical protein BRDID11002_76240 [Bradyrhizobium diazoefficiens]
MCRAERIVVALAALGEAGQAAAGAQGADAVAPPGEDLVRIGLVADVPDQPVARRVEDVMDRGGELDHAETRAEVTAGYRDGIDGLLPQLVGDLANLLDLELAQVVRRPDGVEKRRLTVCVHGDFQFVSAGRSFRCAMGLHNIGAARVLKPSEPPAWGKAPSSSLGELKCAPVQSL